MAPQGSGRRPLTNEPRHAVGMHMTHATNDLFYELGEQWGTSKTTVAAWCLMRGGDAVLQRLGWEGITMPTYLQDRVDPADKPLLQLAAPVSGAAPVATGSTLTVQVRIPQSGYQKLERLAEHCGVPSSTMCAWVCVYGLNLVLQDVGHAPVRAAASVEKRIPGFLTGIKPQDVLVPAMAGEKEERLAS